MANMTQYKRYIILLGKIKSQDCSLIEKIIQKAAEEQYGELGRNVNGADACSIREDFMNVARLETNCSKPISLVPNKMAKAKSGDLVSLANRAENTHSIHLKNKKEFQQHYLMEGLNMDKFKWLVKQRIQNMGWSVFRDEINSVL